MTGFAECVANPSPEPSMLRTALRRHACMAACVPERPVVAIVGATGTGKSNLAVHLAEQFNGEIINGDALQLYEGLPITTNKIPENERKGIPHHLLGCIAIDEPTWTVGKFTVEAIKAVDSIHQKGKLAILVGGTHYYTQSLLLNDQIVSAGHMEAPESQDEQELRWPILGASGTTMLEALREFDPEMASRWHPNDTRKIRRSLEIWLQTGKKASDIYRDQAEGLVCSSECLRVNALVFWVHCESSILSLRTSTRLEQMVTQGLLHEVQAMLHAHDVQVEAGHAVDDTRGIWVAIGYKEFAEYMQAVRNGCSANILKTKMAEGLERAKIATRQYAKRQIRWIRLKLLPAFQAAGAAERFFIVDGTDLDSWTKEVLDKAEDITNRFLTGEALPSPQNTTIVASTLLDNHESRRRTLHSVQTCNTCAITCTTEESWNQHLYSKGHRKATRGQPKGSAMTREGAKACN